MRAPVVTTILVVMQVLLVLAQASPAVLAPVAAAALGLDPARAGIVLAVIFVASAFAGLGSGLVISRLGTSRTCRALLVVGALAWYAVSATSFGVTGGWIPGGGPAGVLLLLGGLVLGAGAGIIVPVSAQILMAVVPARSRALHFSIRQSGVPAGNALAGFLVPALLFLMPWQWVPAAIATALIVTATMLPTFPAGRSPPASKITLDTFTGPLRLVWSRPALRELGLMAFVLTACQISISGNLVSFLVIEQGHTLVVAGAAFAVSQLVGGALRIVWGYAADRWVPARRVLVFLSIGAGASALGYVALTPASPGWALYFLAALTGTTLYSWQGLFYAEVARLAPPGQVSDATGGAQWLLCFGGFLGPVLGAEMIARSGHYATMFLAFGPPAVALGVWMLLRRP